MKYGFMVCELTGEVTDLKTEAKYKPTTERCGFAYAKWFDTIEQRDKIKDFTIQEIKKIQDSRKAINL